MDPTPDHRNAGGGGGFGGLGGSKMKGRSRAYTGLADRPRSSKLDSEVPGGCHPSSAGSGGATPRIVNGLPHAAAEATEATTAASVAVIWSRIHAKK